MRSTACRFVLFALLLALPAAAAGQENPPRHVIASIGILSYELGESGLAPMFAVRAAAPVASVLMLEAGLVASRPEQGLGQSSTFVAPEAQLQLAFPFQDFIPYMGLGVGAALDFRNATVGGSEYDLTISGSLGMRAWFRDDLGVQAEFRGRGIGVDFAGTSAEYSVGVAWRP